MLRDLVLTRAPLTILVVIRPEDRVFLPTSPIRRHPIRKLTLASITAYLLIGGEGYHLRLLQLALLQPSLMNRLMKNCGLSRFLTCPSVTGTSSRDEFLIMGLASRASSASTSVRE